MIVPEVFTSIRGLKAFSSRFVIEWEDRAGGSRSVEVTPEVYERLSMPRALDAPCGPRASAASAP